MQDRIELQIREKSGFRTIAFVQLKGDPKKGLQTATQVEYDVDYATEQTDASGQAAVSCHFPVSLELTELDSWPAFLIDLFPQGAALRYVVDHYRIADQPQNYWQILRTAKLAPPGNLRVNVDDWKQMPIKKSNQTFQFSRKDVVSKGPRFVQYMVESGAPISGTTGAGGASPKFLLREDLDGFFHAEGELPDHKTKHSWLVKYPRSKDTLDREILRQEATLYDLATLVGLDTNSSLDWEDDCLFIPRFDRRKGENGMDYFGMESFYSLVSHVEFGSRLLHETYIDALSKYSSNLEEDIAEYVLRDLFNLMVGNTDNHGRNQSVLKNGERIRISPLYDVAPMKFDREGIVRNTSWGFQEDKKIVLRISEYLAKNEFVTQEYFRKCIFNFRNKCEVLEARLKEQSINSLFYQGTLKDRELVLSSMEDYLKNG